MNNYNNQQEAMYSEIMMIKALTETCGRKALSKSHKSTQVDSSEAAAYKNCVAKFIMAPQFIMNSMNPNQYQ